MGNTEEGQKAKFEPKTNEIKWELARFPGLKEHTLRAKLTLTKVIILLFYFCAYFLMRKINFPSPLTTNNKAKRKIYGKTNITSEH